MDHGKILRPGGDKPCSLSIKLYIVPGRQWGTVVGEGFTICPAARIQESVIDRNFTITCIDFDRQLFENLSKAAPHDAFTLV